MPLLPWKILSPYCQISITYPHRHNATSIRAGGGNYATVCLTLSQAEGEFTVAIAPSVEFFEL